MSETDEVLLDLGLLKVYFSKDDKIRTDVAFSVKVPFGSGPGKVSTSNFKIEDGSGQSFQLLVVIFGAGVGGEIASLSYSLYQTT
ncbi:hypothetical protein [Aurantiacibacter suaedae]|uniref:hypothetical protein n=1 Tax=Aurantiacibacter suaedae TaxID=2545755 RepID=UPI0010F54E18|nr:hypothetical protein [Aurantiacibacter suaedae]